MKKSESGIIIGFPGVGKTYACQHSEEIGMTLVDSDSSNFHWLIKEDGLYAYDEAGSKIIDPAWPKNYLTHIDQISHEENHPDYIMVSSHPEIMKGIINMGFKKIFVVCPSKSMKKKFMESYMNRGSDLSFIENMDKNFDKFIDDVFTTAMNAENVNVLLIEIRPNGKIQNVTDFLKKKINIAFEEFEEGDDND